MSKLASKLSRQILAVLLSIAMIMPNMTAYASEVSGSDSILPASEVVETDDTSAESDNISDETDVEGSIADDAQPSDTEDELPGDEDETINVGEEGDLGEADESDASEDGDVSDSDLEADAPMLDEEAEENEAKDIQPVEVLSEVRAVTPKTWVLTGSASEDGDGNKYVLCTGGSADNEADKLKLGANVDLQGSHAQMSGGPAKIEIPVAGNCTVKITYYYAADAQIGIGEDRETFTTVSGSTSIYETHSYLYVGGAGTVEIITDNGKKAYITKVEISDPAYSADVKVVKATDAGEDEEVPTARELSGIELALTMTKDAAGADVTNSGPVTYVIGEKPALEPGTYSVALAGKNNSCVQDAGLQLTFDDLIVAESRNNTLTVKVKGYDSSKTVKSWSFDEAQFQTEAFKNNEGVMWYKGLELKGVKAYNNEFASMSNTKKVSIPVKKGASIVVRFYKNANAMIGGVALATTTEENEQSQTYEYTGDDGYVEIVAKATAYLIGIDVTYPVSTGYVPSGETSFKSLESGTDLTTYAAKGIEIKGFAADGQNHGIKAGANASMVLNLESGKTADITVLTCRYGSNGVTATVPDDTEDSGVKALKVAEGSKAEGDAKAPELTVLGAEGEVTLAIGEGTYIHSITVDYYDNASYEAKYTVTVDVKKGDNNKENGTASVAKAYYKDGVEVPLTVTPDQGYKPTITLKENKENGTVIDITVADNKFTMPKKDVIVEVTFTAPGASHDIAVAETVANGTVEAGGQTTAHAGTLVKMEDVATATPATGYELKEWQVTYKDAAEATQNVTVTQTGNKYSFTMPDANITITPVFQAAVVKYFQTTDFFTKFSGHTKNDEVTDVDGLTVISGIKWWDNQHGLTVGNGGSMKLNLEPGKKYDITVWGCNYGQGATVKAAYNNGTDDVEVDLVKDENVDLRVKSGAPEKGPKFTLLNAQGEVTLTFGGGSSYVHSIEVAESSGVAQYTVTVTADENGTAKADKSLAPEGTEIKLTAEPDSHYKLKEWKVISGDVEVTDNKFTMPAKAVEVKAIFEPINRRDWDFANDAELKGDNGAEVTGTTETVAGLGIDATAADSGWNSKGEGTDGAVANNKTKITVSVDGVCKIRVSAEKADYTVDGKAAATAEETFDCEGTDGKVVIEMTGDNHIKAINVMPIYYVKAGTYNFSSIKRLVIDGFSFNNIEQKGNSHGCESSAANASMTLNLSGKANITVLNCRYGAVEKGENIQMEATSGTVTRTLVDESGADRPEFKVKNADAGELTLSFNNEQTLWFHSIEIEYISDVQDEYTDGIDVWDFGAEQLDTKKYNNMLTEDIINSWYPGITPGTAGINLKSFEVTDENGVVDFKFSDGGHTDTHRLRTTNTKLTRTDEKSITVGDTTYTGYIYSNKSSDKGVYVGVRLNAGDIMTAVVSSNGNDYTISVENPDGDVQNIFRPAGPSIITYYATTSGMHKIYNGTDEKLVVARVTRQHSKAVTVSGKVEIPAEITEQLSLEFTCKESGLVRTAEVVRNADAAKAADVVEGSYEVSLFENYNYDVLVKPTIYVADEGSELQLGAANAAQTATHNIKVAIVPRHTLSGSIVGLDDDAMSKLAIEFKKPANKIYIPEISIKADKTYTADLESGTEYTIIAKGINDYELDSTANNNSDRIRITSPTIGRNITYTKKPVYNVTIQPEGATTEDLKTAKFVFTNINEEGYVYTFTGTEGIQLRDGTYSVVVSDSGDYKQKLTTNLVVNGADVTKPIAFVFGGTRVTKWDFTDGDNYDEQTHILKNPCNGLSYTGGNITQHNETYGGRTANVVITVPVFESGNVVVTVGNSWDISSGDFNDLKASGGGFESLAIPYTNDSNTVSITVGDGGTENENKVTTYIKSIEVKPTPKDKYEPTITVGKDKDYQTINDALAAVRSMNRADDDGKIQHVTIAIDPGDYEEMLVIDTENVTLKNASATPSIGLRNKGVDIDPTAVRITSYYGHGYTYYSMDSNCKWDAEVLATNKANGYPSFKNPGSGTTSNSYWNATVSITASNVSAEGIIFENSFNQYVSKKAAEDIIVKQNGAREGSVPRASMAAGDTKVQEKEYVERAAALAIYNDCAKISFDNCKFIGRQDTLYGGSGVTASFYGCSIYGGTDYIMGGMTAVFAKCDLVFNTNDQTSNGIKNDVGYITAAQQSSGRGYLMYNCHVTSTIPGVDTASQYTSKPGYLGRPWEGKTGEAVFYKTIIDEADANWRDPKGTRISLIVPEGWNSSLGGESTLSQEAGTYEVSGVESNHYQELGDDGKVTKAGRVTWSTLLTGEQLSDGKPISVATFLGDWTDAFEGKDMTIVLPSDTNIAKPAAPTAIVTPEPETTGGDENPVTTVIKGASIVLSAETGAKVYYLVNPDEDAELNAEKGTPYAGAIKVEGSNIKNDSITIKAIAVKYGQTSEPLTVTYAVTETPDTSAPILPAEGNIQLGSRIKISAQAGAEIYYNVNSEDAPATLYTGKDGIEITTKLVKKEDSTTTIKAVAILNGKTSEVASATYNVLVNAPKANYRNGYQFPDGGGKVELTADEDVTIYYVTGTDADAVKDIDLTNAESGRKTYDKKGITVTADTTIKAIANRGSRYSDAVTLSYIVPLSMPTANPGSGSVLPANARTVKLTADEGATVYYTTGTVVADVEDPANEESDRKTYNDETGITVTAETTVIKAVAVKGNRHSVVAVFTYTLSDVEFEQVEALTAKVNNSSVSNGGTKTVNEGTDVTVTLETATADADIYYTLDGKTPVVGSNKYRSTGIVINAISETTVIKAFATKKDMLSSDVFTVTINVREVSQGGDDSGLIIKFVDEGAGTYEYTGSAIKPDIEVRNNGKLLVPGTDYTVKYSNNINVPTTAKKPTVTVTGKGILSGKATQEFTITPKSFENVNAAGDNDVIAGRIVVAKDKKVPAPSVYYGNTKLKAGKDFEYDKNKTYPAEKDDETLPITGKGNFEGTLNVPVKVVADAKAVKDAVKKFAVGIDKTKSKALMYTGESLAEDIEKCITVNAKDSSKTDLKANAAQNYILVLPKDKDITNAGTVKFTVVGIGEYSGCNVTKSCKILPRTIAKEDVVIDKGGAAAADGKVLVSGITDKAAFASTGATFPDMSLTYGSDKTDMKLGVDYKVSYSSNKKVADGKAKYTITFMGNYKGKYVSDAFNIDNAELDTDTAEVVIPDMVCNGKDGVYKAKPYVTIDNVTLKASEYTVTYYLDEAMTTQMDKTNKLSLGEGISKTVYVKIEPSAKSNYKNTDKDKTLTGSYTVWKKGSKETDLSKAKVTFYEGTATKATSKLPYTGNPIELIKLDSSVTPADGNFYIKVEVNKVTVPADAYKVEYVSNVNKGKATVVIKPADTSAQDDTTTAYTGGKVATFTISARKLDNKDWFSEVAEALGF